MANREQAIIPRWLAAILAAGALALLAGGAFFYENQRHYVRADVEDGLESIAAAKVADIDAWRTQRLNDAAVISQSRFFSAAAARWLAAPDAATTTGLLERLRATCTYYGYANVTLVDTQGLPRLRSVAGAASLTATTAAALAGALRTGHAVLTDLHLARDGSRPHLDVIAPLFVNDDTHAAPFGAVVLQINARDSLFPLLRTWPTASRTGESLLVQRDGNDALFLSDLRYETNAALRLRIPMAQTNVLAVMAIRGRHGLVNGLDYRGVPVLSVLQPVPNSDWFLVTKMDEAEALAAWRARSGLILALFVVLVATLAASVGIAWQRQAKSRYREMYLTEAARRQSEARYRTTLMSVGDAVIVTNVAGNVELLNPVAEALTGWPQAEARGLPLETVFRIVHEETRLPLESPLRRVLQQDLVVGLANHTCLLARDGVERPIDDSASPIRNESGAMVGVVLVFRDVSDAHRRRREREFSLALLRLLNRHDNLRDLIHNLTDFLQAQTGCSAVGVRLREGDDFPYFETRGFPAEFVKLENSLCMRDLNGQLCRDSSGNPALDCLCGNVLCERFDPTKPVFTARGSFWSNSTTELLASTTAADRQANMRNRCNGEGYESVALIRLRAGDQTLGLLQFNDRAKGRFTPELLAFLEGAADQIAIAVAERRTRESLHASESLYRSLFDHMLNGLAYCRMSFVENQPVDFTYLAVNRAFETLTGLRQVVGRRVSEVIPGIREADPEIFALYGRVASTGVPERIEIFVHALKMWFDVSVYCPKPGDFVAVFDVITARKQAEQALAAERQFLSTLIDTMPDMIFVKDPDGRFTLANAAFAAKVGAPSSQSLLGKTDYDISPRDVADAYRRDDRQVMKTGATLLNREETMTNAAGQTCHLLTTKVALLKPDDTLEGLLGICRDVTDRANLQHEKARMEEQLRQAQKMESVGRLAGGVAHDFNNMLQAILGHTELALLETPVQTPLHETLRQIEIAALHSAELTRKLLAFARKQTIQPRVLNLNDIVTHLHGILRRLIGENIELRWQPGDALWPVRIDPSQVEQILTNLTVNARDAIDGVGRVNIETANTTLDASYCDLHPEVAPGDYVVLTVSDNGRGIDKDVLAHAFEPFFTTKQLGTGLGLATVYGIARQNGGSIHAYSEPGQGATFRIFLPRHADAAAAVTPTAAAAAAAAAQTGTETVLLVEDEASIRQQVGQMIARLGYTVLVADKPAEAIRLVQEHAGVIHLLITDVIMPEMNGRALAERLVALRPGLKCLFISGYTADVIARGGVLEDGLHFIQKPFATVEIASKIRRTLESA